MSQQQKSYWESYMGVEMAFWNAFANDPKNLSLKPKLSDENGMPKEGATADDDGYHYKVKRYVSKKNNEPYYKVIKSRQKDSAKPTGDPIIDTLPKSEAHIAAASVRQEYSEGARKGHEENVQMHKEKLAASMVEVEAIGELRQAVVDNTIAVRNLNASFIAIWQETKHLIEEMRRLKEA